MAKIDTTRTLAPPLAAWSRLAANSTAHMVEHLFNGVIADAYGLPAALLAIAVFPLLAAVVMILLFNPANVRK